MDFKCKLFTESESSCGEEYGEIEKSSNTGTTLVTQPQVASNAVSWAPGEVLRSSGKFYGPSTIARKSCIKDQVLIGNAESRKGSRSHHRKKKFSRTSKCTSYGSCDESHGSETSSDSDRPFQHLKKIRNATTQTKQTLTIIKVRGKSLRISGDKELMKTAEKVLVSHFTKQTKTFNVKEDLKSIWKDAARLQRPNKPEEGLLKTTIPSSYPLYDRQTFSQKSPSPFISSEDVIANENNLPLMASLLHSDGTPKTTIEPHKPCPFAFPMMNDSEQRVQDLLPQFKGFIDTCETIPPPTERKPQFYSREFLLDCARLNVSHHQPSNLSDNFKEISHKRESPNLGVQNPEETRNLTTDMMNDEQFRRYFMGID